MKTALFNFILIFFVTSLYAQTSTPKAPGTIKGIVIDSAKNTPLGYATIAVIDAVTKQPVKSNLTKDNGLFEISGLLLKPYLLNIISVGYGTKTISIDELKAGKLEVNAGKIILSASSAQLGEVKVTATKALVKQEIDRVSYDVQADPESKAQTAMDMLRKVPLVTVDGDDNIQLQGSGSYKIFINGKPSALMTNNPKDVLRSMPAGSIQKIEVITTPPSKYDSEGLAGIINIITTKKLDDGYNGTLTSRYSFPWGPNVNLTATVKHGKFGLSGYLGSSLQPDRDTKSVNYRQNYTPASLLTQNNINTNGGHYIFGSIETSYELDTLNLLNASLNYNNGRFNADQERNTQFTSDALGTLPQSYLLLNNGENSWKGIEASVNYQLGFERNKQQLLTTSYEYSYFSDGQFNNLSTINRVNYNNPDNIQRNDAGTKEHTLQLDYVHPLKQLTIEGGAKAIFRKNYSESDVQNLTSVNGQNIYVDQPGLNNNFEYQQNVFSLYNSYTYKLTRWTFKGGVRMEHTAVNANFTTNGSNLDMAYTNLVPSLSVMRTLKNNQSLTLGVTNRLERPGIWQLNPFIDRSNPQVLFTGNPDLKPVLSHLFELTYTRSGTGSLSTKISYLYTGNSIVSVNRLLSDTVSLSTYDNVGKNRIARLNINGNYPITKKLNVNFNTGIFYVWIQGTYNGQFFSNKGPRTNTFANASYKPGSDWTLGANGGYNRRYINLQGGSNDYYYSSFSVSKVLLNKKLTVTGVVNNPFKRYYYFKSYTSTPDFYQENTKQQFYRGFNFSLSYKFGKLSSDIKKNQRSINNDDVSGKSN